MAKDEPLEAHDGANAEPATGFSVFTAEEKRFVLPRKLGDRLLAFVLSCVLTGFFALEFARLDRETPSGWLLKAVRVLGIEVMFSFGIFSVLALIWAVFTPRSFESFLNRSVRKVLVTNRNCSGSDCVYNPLLHCLLNYEAFRLAGRH